MPVETLALLLGVLVGAITAGLGIAVLILTMALKGRRL